MLQDIASNLIADVLFVAIVGILFSWAIFIGRRRALDEAFRLLGLSGQTEIKIYISGFHNAGVASGRVVNALEYDSAIELRAFIQGLQSSGILLAIASFLGGLIGRPIPLADVLIEVAPLDDVESPPFASTLLLLGGPRSNQLTRYFMRDKPHFRFNDDAHAYEEAVDDHYVGIPDPHNVAVVEKLIVAGQVVLLLHGYGESHTRDAVRYLINNWRFLSQKFADAPFALRVSTSGGA